MRLELGSNPIVPTCDNRVAGFIAAFSAGLRAGFYFLHNCARAAAFIVTSRTCLCSYTGDKVPQDFWKDLLHQFSYFSRKSIQEGTIPFDKLNTWTDLVVSTFFKINNRDPLIARSITGIRLFHNLKLSNCEKCGSNCDIGGSIVASAGTSYRLWEMRILLR